MATICAILQGPFCSVMFYLPWWLLVILPSPFSIGYFFSSHLGRSFYVHYVSWLQGRLRDSFQLRNSTRNWTFVSWISRGLAWILLLVCFQQSVSPFFCVFFGHCFLQSYFFKYLLIKFLGSPGRNFLGAFLSRPTLHLTDGSLMFTLHIYSVYMSLEVLWHSVAARGEAFYRGHSWLPIPPVFTRTLFRKTSSIMWRFAFVSTHHFIYAVCLRRFHLFLHFSYHSSRSLLQANFILPCRLFFFGLG